MIAVTHPGKMGDMLYCLPATFALSRYYNCQVDFFTSDYCKPLVPLLSYQDEIRHVYIPKEYKIKHMAAGVQPWKIPVNDEDYIHVFHLGIQSWPEKDMITYCSEIAGVHPLEFALDFPSSPKSVPRSVLNKHPVVISSSRGVDITYLQQICARVIQYCPVIHVGWPNETILDGASNKIMPSVLDTASIMYHSRLFISGIGLNTVMSMAFPELESMVLLPRMGMDMRHNPRMSHVDYYIEPSIQDFLPEVIKRIQ